MQFSDIKQRTKWLKDRIDFDITTTILQNFEVKIIEKNQIINVEILINNGLKCNIEWN